jgi:hypothetical protein
MLPKLNRKRALFVLTKIDEILAWERRSEAERDTRFVEYVKCGRGSTGGWKQAVSGVQAEGVRPYVDP